MENSQSIKILASMNKQEFRDFGKFLLSPYFNNRSEVVRLYDTLKPFYPGFDSKKINEENIFGNVYPGKKFNDELLRKVFSLFNNLALDFFAIADFRENTLDYNVRIADKLREKKLNAMFERRAKIIDKLFQQNKHTFDYYESKYKYSSILNGFLLHKDENKMVQSLQGELDDFMEYFFSVSLLMYIRLSEWFSGYSIKKDLILYDEVLNHLANDKYKDVTLVYLYQNMLLLLRTNREEYFFKLLEGRKKFEDKLSAMDLYNISIVLIQYCYKRVTKGDSHFRKYQFDSVKLILELNLIPEGFIEPYFFINSVRNAAVIREFEWCEKFISDLSNRLNPEHAEETSSYSKALVEFYRGNYGKALEYTSWINPDRSVIKIELKNIQLVIYYELGYSNELYALVDSYKHFLSRAKDLADESKQNCSRFIRYIIKLEKIRSEENKEDAVLLLKEIEQAVYFNFKEWFVAKLKQLS